MNTIHLHNVKSIKAETTRFVRDDGTHFYCINLRITDTDRKDFNLGLFSSDEVKIKIDPSVTDFKV